MSPTSQFRQLQRQAPLPDRTTHAGSVRLAVQHSFLESTFAKRTTLRHEVEIRTRNGSLVVEPPIHLVLADRQGDRRILAYGSEASYGINPGLPCYEFIELSESEWLIYDYKLLQSSN